MSRSKISMNSVNTWKLETRGMFQTQSNIQDEAFSKIVNGLIAFN